jgi:hypothetical protein
MPAETGPPIVASWRANGPDVEVEPGWYLVAIDVGGWLYAVATFDEDEKLFVSGGRFAGRKWEDVAWFVPVAELNPCRIERDGGKDGV